MLGVPTADGRIFAARSMSAHRAKAQQNRLLAISPNFRFSAAQVRRRSATLIDRSWIRRMIGRKLLAYPIDFIGAPRSMKMGNTRSPSNYDLGAYARCRSQSIDGPYGSAMRFISQIAARALSHGAFPSACHGRGRETTGACCGSERLPHVLRHSCAMHTLAATGNLPSCFAMK